MHRPPAPGTVGAQSLTFLFIAWAVEVLLPLLEHVAVQEETSRDITKKKTEVDEMEIRLEVEHVRHGVGIVRERGKLQRA